MNKKWKRILFCLITVLFVGICVGKMKFDAYATDTAVVGDANDDTNFNVEDLTRVKRYTLENDVTINQTNADLNNDSTINENDLQHCREFLVKGYSVVTGSYEYTSGTYENGILTNSEDTVAVKMGDINATVNAENRTFEAAVANGTHDVALSSSYFQDVTVSSVEVNDATNVEATFTVPKMTTTDYTYNDSATEYGVWNGATPKLVGMSAEGGFTTTATMRPYYNSRYRGNIGVSVNGNTFYILPYRDHNTYEILIHVSESMEEAWDYTNAKSVGGTGKILTDNSSTSKCTLELTYLNGNYYVSVQLPGDNTTSPAIVLNPQSTGLDEKYFASGTRQVQFCGLTDMTEYYSDITYQIGDDAANAALASATEYAIPKLDIATPSTYIDTGIVAKEGFVMSYKISKYETGSVWEPSGVTFTSSSGQRNFMGIGFYNHQMKKICCKEWVDDTYKNSFSNIAVSTYDVNDEAKIVYWQNKYYVILPDQIIELSGLSSFTANNGIGSEFFATGDRTIGFQTSREQDRIIFENVNISLGDDAAEAALTEAGVTY